MQSKQDRCNYYLLLHKYESYLDLLSDLIIRAQVEAGPDDYTPEMKREFVRTRDRIYTAAWRHAASERRIWASFNCWMS
jgi:hypothetical protein